MLFRSHVKTQVVFEDGHTGILEADVKISDAEHFSVDHLTAVSEV